ncbi:hypothetical protein LADH09A_003516 [Micromonospora sp. LAH09]|uniref:hypothetical protein n=1 Tax=Micromonospora cabrerizensis TaxID=2911213 RepID=UPI001EE9AEAE|nr:hypothetical protein [Micromonospora cabrerizensis]MCG5469598.1 hypothetical protein [Micromonospora cabrerizensis]
MATLSTTVLRLQQSQISVQALTRLSSVALFLYASWADNDRLALVALLGTLLAIPYTLMEALVGRPLSAGVVPDDWNLESWARRVSALVALPVAAVAFLSVSVALPQSSLTDRFCVIAPVLLQLPVEAMFWACARTRSPGRANLIPQLTALGTLVSGALLLAADVRVDIAAIPAQLAVLAWVTLRPRSATAGRVRPRAREGLAVGSVYCLAALADLAYTITLPSVAGAAAGQSAVVVLRAMDLVFGPFHVVLSASTREDIVAGRAVRWRSLTRALTLVAWLGVSVVVLASEQVRRLLAPDLAAVGLAVVAGYCAYKLLVAISTWLSVRHMIHAVPRRYLVSAIGSRVVAFGGVAVALVWAIGVSDLVLQLLLCEALVVAWFMARMRSTPADPAPEDARPVGHVGAHRAARAAVSASRN